MKKTFQVPDFCAEISVTNYILPDTLWKKVAHRSAKSAKGRLTSFCRHDRMCGLIINREWLFFHGYCCNRTHKKHF